jgi:hypothetical protein
MHHRVETSVNHSLVHPAENSRSANILNNYSFDILEIKAFVSSLKTLGSNQKAPRGFTWFGRAYP